MLMTKPPKAVKLIWDEQYWRDRAEEARAVQADLTKADCKRVMADIAKTYDRLADLTRNFKIAAEPRKLPSNEDGQA
jgi:hypothetical protein